MAGVPGLLRAPALRPAGRRRFAPTFDFAPGKIVEPQVLIPAACRGYNRLVIYHVFHALIWLGCQDSNLGMPESKSGALPLGDTPICNSLLSSRTCIPRFEFRPGFIKKMKSDKAVSFCTAVSGFALARQSPASVVAGCSTQPAPSVRVRMRRKHKPLSRSCARGHIRPTR